MKPITSKISQPAEYVCVVGSHLDTAGFLPDGQFSTRYAYTHDKLPITVIKGKWADQVALHSFLAKIRDRGVPLYQLICLDKFGQSISQK